MDLYPVIKKRGYPVKIQKVERPSNRSFYLNFPMVLAETLQVQKGETFEWIVEDKNTLLLIRSKPLKFKKFNSLG